MSHDRSFGASRAAQPTQRTLSRTLRRALPHKTVTAWQASRVYGGDKDSEPTGRGEGEGGCDIIRARGMVAGGRG